MFFMIRSYHSFTVSVRAVTGYVEEHARVQRFTPLLAEADWAPVTMPNRDRPYARNKMPWC
jgi:hypothetical protein